ncbi:Arginyl aminopeptidase @ Leucyl aminopeptidase [uncultured Coleofasciculus sp.]|uniref:Arginyl aminopeptidase @ Leucyl aminopeptidase n=1 Tax=uncultured Coleofasciculus sp. TaxID=1267456 RepID=A0A6J4K8E7_9CYAN|nr:Arginyl aminopeptidase @ Leucyl aminopeptidase [uncultured Coleofasciculus sp.]
MQLQLSIKLLVASASVLSLGVPGYTPPRSFGVQVQQPTPSEQAQELTPNQPAQSPSQPGRASADVQALVALGPRVAGTPVMDKASSYLLEEYRKAGYVAEVQTFTYSKFQDLGSTLTVGSMTIPGRALKGSLAGKLMAPLVAVPNVGRPADFASVNVKGAIAIVRRGEIPFLQKAQNAATAGAVGLIIVNAESGNFSGTLGGATPIPVLALSGEQGKPLLVSQAGRASVRRQSESLEVSLNVNTREGLVTGRNVVAHLEGVTKPSVLLGGHYDSVVGSPGANDNASGTAVVLEIARNLSSTPLARQAWFVAFDGEEDGLQGSRAFVKAAQPQLISGLKAMLNFDMVGVNKQLGVGGASSLTALALAADPKISTFQSNDSSDHASFAAAGVPVLFFYRGQEPNYHSPNDKQVDPRLLDETVRVGQEVVKRSLL